MRRAISIICWGISRLYWLCRLFKKRWPSIQITREQSSVWILIQPTIRNWMPMAGTINRALRWWCRCVAKEVTRKICSRQRTGISIKCQTIASNDSKCVRISTWRPQSTEEIISSKRTSIVLVWFIHNNQFVNFLSRSASNIVFSNGLLDPWSGGGVLRSKSNKITIIIIPDAAHHLDLRASHPNDPGSVRQARDMERMAIKSWLSETDFYWSDFNALNHWLIHCAPAQWWQNSWFTWMKYVKLYETQFSLTINEKIFWIV